MFMPFRSRTKFERNLFVSILLIAVVLGATSVLSLVLAQNKFEGLLRKLWIESGSVAVQDDVAFFARERLNDLAEVGVKTLLTAAAECPVEPADRFVDCILEHLDANSGQRDDLPPLCVQLYIKDAGAWQLVGERRMEKPLGFGRSPSDGLREFRIRPLDLDEFERSGEQPPQRMVGNIMSVAHVDSDRTAGGGAGAIVLVSATDSVFTAHWQRSLATVERPSFAPVFSDLIRLQSVWILSALVVVGLIAIVVSRVLSVRVSRPLAELVSAMERVSTGDLGYRAQPPAQEEFGFLVESFNSMTDNVQRLNEETRQTARMKRELEMGREIQLKLFPGVLKQPEGYDLFGTNVPSLEVSGDYYDVLPWGDEGDLALAIGDVSGKGIPAAIVMSNAQACLHSQSLKPGAHVHDSAKILNRLLMENTDVATFVTFVLAILSPRDRRLAYVNCGHNPPILLRADGEVLELTSGGPIIGVVPDAPYSSETIDLCKGDVLCMYTDGITEAVAPNEEEFGAERLTKLLLENANLSAQAISLCLIEAVREYSGLEQQADDITILVLKVVEKEGLSAY